MPFKLTPFTKELTSEEKEHVESIVDDLFAGNVLEHKLEKAGNPSGESYTIRMMYEDILPEEDVDHSEHYFISGLSLPEGMEDVNIARQMDELATAFNDANEETYGDMFYTLLGKGFISPLKPNFPYHKELYIIVARGKVTKALTCSHTCHNM